MDLDKLLVELVKESNPLKLIFNYTLFFELRIKLKKLIRIL